MRSHKDLVQLLCEEGAPVNAENEVGCLFLGSVTIKFIILLAAVNVFNVTCDVAVIIL